MIFKETKIEGVYIIELEPYKDERGFFSRNFCKEEFAEAGIDFDIKQVNMSLTKEQGVIRGMHYQKEPKLEDKIVQCLQGRIFDVVLDLRPNSPTYREWEGIELDKNDFRMVFIPKMCAHGFQTLSNDCLIQYFVSEFYAPKLYGGVRWDDPKFEINWPITPPTFISEKDKNWSIT